MALAARIVDWQPLRDAFVKRNPRPTHAELSAEFSVPQGTIGVCAAEEGWTSLRAAHLDSELARADASSVLLEAVKIDRSLVRSICDLALVAFAKIKDAVTSIDDSRAPQTKLDALNTAGFATANFTRALKDAGVVGLPAGLASAGKEDNGRWNPQMLSQINLTVQNLVGQAEKAGAAVAAVQIPPADPAPGKRAEITPTVET